MKARAHVFVTGTVQGVFFRANTCDRARALGLTGWVRNTGSGGVEAVFEGEKEAIEKVIEFCRHGPPGARVDNVDAEWESLRNEFDSFEVRY